MAPEQTDAESRILFEEQEHLEDEALRHAASSGGRGGPALQRDPPPPAKAALRGVAAAALCTALRDLWAAHSLQLSVSARCILSAVRDLPETVRRSRAAPLAAKLMADAKALFVAGAADLAADKWRVAVLLQLLALRGGGGGGSVAALTLLAELLGTRMRARPHVEVRPASEQV